MFPNNSWLPDSNKCLIESMAGILLHLPQVNISCKSNKKDRDLNISELLEQVL